MKPINPVKKIRLEMIITMIFLSTIIFLLLRCRNDVNDPYSMNQFDLCYIKQFNCNWEVCLNNISGKRLKNISNFNSEDSEPNWSPNGENIIFTRHNLLSSDIFLYNIPNNSLKNISVDSIDENIPRWLPDGSKILYQYHKIGEKEKTYIMNPDGSEKKKLLDYSAYIYFLKDNFRFIYKPSLLFDNNEEYFIILSDLNGSTKEKILDLKKVNKHLTLLEDFNKNTNEILLTIESRPHILNIIAKYNIQSKKTDTISIADSGWIYFRPKYSNDYSKISVIELDNNKGIGKILIIDKYGKKELINLENPKEWIDYNPMTFSPNDRYLAFSINIDQPTQMVSWKSYLYIIDINTKVSHYIDEANCAKWNPKYDR